MEEKNPRDVCVMRVHERPKNYGVVLPQQCIYIYIYIIIAGKKAKAMKYVTRTHTH